VIIDIHNHYIPPSLLEGTSPLSLLKSGENDSVRLLVAGSVQPPQPASLLDLERQDTDSGRQGIDAKVLAVPPFLFLYELDPASGISFTQRVNNEMAKAAASGGNTKWIPVGTVALQDPMAATSELKRGVQELGLKGFTIATSVAGRDLDDPALLPFFQAAADLRVPILIHPSYVPGGDRLRKYYLRNLIGNPVETAIAAACLVFGGVMAALPDLRVILSHGGGVAPYIAGRWRHGSLCRPECRSASIDPVEGVKRFYYDTVTHDAGALRYLVDFAGAGHTLLGSDYPFDMGDEEPVKSVLACGLKETETSGILGNNAAELYSISR
jgi:aminocarboxymuconate-semialdehyde decarboxylase